MKLTEREKAYHDGYKQGRFDEYAECMGYDQAEKVKAKIDKQKNCPYCHKNILGQIKQIIKLTMNDDELEPDIHEILVDPRHSQIALQGYVGGRGEYSALKKINYCPMCGRPLNKN